MTTRPVRLARFALAVQVVALLGLLAQWPLAAYSCHNAKDQAPNGLRDIDFHVTTVSCEFAGQDTPYFILDLQLLPVAAGALLLLVGIVATAQLLRSAHRVPD